MSVTQSLLPAIALLGALLVGQQMSHPDHMEHRFDKPAELAKSWDDPSRDAWQMPDRVIRELDLKRGQTVADIGAGTGYFSVRLARTEAAPKVYAVDIEPAMITYLKDRASRERVSNLVPILAEPDDPKLPGTVDVVLIVDTYHHIGGREAYFRRLIKSLKPGGRVAIVDFRPDSPEGPPKEFRFTAAAIQSEMSKAGYKLEAKHDFLPRQHFLIFAVAKAR